MAYEHTREKALHRLLRDRFMKLTNIIKCNNLKKIIVFICLTILCSCTEKKHRDLSDQKEQNKIDTLRFPEKIRDKARLDFKWDKYTPDSLIPRGVWVDLRVNGINEMSKIIMHSNLSLKSKDTLLEVKKISNSEFKIRISKDYSGYLPSHGGECLILESYIQPKKDYLFESYWLEKGIVYPSWTNLFLHYLPIEEK